MSKVILVLGAGKSSGVLIQYLLDNAAEHSWHVLVADASLENAGTKVHGSPHGEAIVFDSNNEQQRHELIERSDVVISMLPAFMHPTIAADCITYKKHLITPSYVSDAMLEIDQAAKDNGLLFLNEMGLDPGIDHMSAMHIMDKLRAGNVDITGLKSHCGGLVAPESDTNLWHYKFSWNPRNVILAGQGADRIKYLSNGTVVETDYTHLFAEAYGLSIDGAGYFESYPNRDSLKYIKAYGLENARTVYRGTLRQPPYCKAWNALIQLQLTNNEQALPFEHTDFTLLDFWAVQLSYLGVNLEEASLAAAQSAVVRFLHLEEGDGILFMLQEAGLFSEKIFTKGPNTAATVLQAVLEEAWQLKPEDRDLVVMIHEVFYSIHGIDYRLQSSLYVKGGEDNINTAMAKTVGLPIAIATKLLLTGQIVLRGVQMPVMKELYEPILEELKQHGIVFEEKTATC